MTEVEEKALMERYGITREDKTVFHYGAYTYDRLTDALNYARVDRDRLQQKPEGPPR